MRKMAGGACGGTAARELEPRPLRGTLVRDMLTIPSSLAMGVERLAFTYKYKPCPRAG